MSSNKWVLKSGSVIPVPVHGIEFELKLIVLFLWRALRHKIQFKLLSNVNGYDCWDDLIVQYYYKDKNGGIKSKIALVQAKHALDATKKEVTLEHLSGYINYEKRKKFNDKNFVLTKYIKGYTNFRNNVSPDDGIPIDCIMYTNRRFSKNMSDYILSKNTENEPDKSFELLNTKASNVARKLNIEKFKAEYEDIKNLLCVENSYEQGFVDSLIYYMDQSNEEDINEVIKDEYSFEYPDDNKNIVESVLQEVLAYVKTWRERKTKDGEYQEFLTHENRIFETARENVILKDIQSCSIQKLDVIPYQDLHFSHEYLCGFVNDASGSIVNVFTSKNAATLTTLKVFQAFVKDENTLIIIDIQKLIKYYEFHMISGAQTKHVLIINCINKTEDSKTMFQHLAKVISVNFNIKIILIRTDEQYISYFSAPENKAETNVVDCYSLTQFTIETRNKILEKTIKLQARVVKMSSLMCNTSKLEMTPDNMQDVLEGRISIGPKLENLKTVAPLYLQRIFHREYNVNASVLSDNSFEDTLFMNATSEDDFRKAGINKHRVNSKKALIVSSDGKIVQEKFDQFCRDNPNMNVHLVQIVAQKDNIELKWKKSSKSIINIIQYFEDAQLTTANVLKEEDFFIATTNNQITLITDIAGMGKTCVLISLANNYSILESDLVLQCDVQKLANVCRENKNKNYLNDGTNAIQFLLSHIMHDHDDIDLTLRFVQNTNIRIFLDGIDEISRDDYDKILELIKCLTSLSNTKIYISSRPNLQRELEKTFDTISYKLQGFTRDAKLEFLNKFYNSELVALTISKDKIRKFSNYVMEILEFKLVDSVQEIAGIPLVTKMIAEIYLEELKYSLDDSVSLSIEEVNKISLFKIYNEFFRRKCKLYYMDKLGHILRGKREKDKLNKDIEEALENHKILAVYLFCKEEGSEHSDLLNTNELNLLNVLLKMRSESDFGIVTEITKNEDVTFVHRSFAEYLFAESILINMKKGISLESITKFKIFTDDKWTLVQKFIESYLSDDFDNIFTDLYKSIIDLKLHKTETSPLSTAATGGNYYICKLLLDSINKHFSEDTSTSSDEDRLQVLNTLIQRKGPNGLNALHHAIIGYTETKDDIVSLFLSQVTAIQNINDLVYNGKTILHLAVENNCSELIIHKIISYKDVDINMKDKYGITALHKAAGRGFCDIIKLLLAPEEYRNVKDSGDIDETSNDYITRPKRTQKRRADIHVKTNNSDTALHVAARGGKCEVVTLLLEHQADINFKNDDGDTALHVAACCDDCDVVTLLLDHQADINEKNNDGETALFAAALCGHFDVVTLLLEYQADINIKNNFGNTALHLFARLRQCDVVTLLLKHKAEIDINDDDGDTALHVAARSGHCDVVTLLLDHQCDINIKDDCGEAALHVAARNGLCDVVKLLLAHHCDINIKDYFGDAALHVAARSGLCDVVTLLLEHQCDVNIKDDNSNTALHVAARGGHCDVVTLLLEHKVDINIHDDDGNTALHDAARGGHCDLVTLLLEHQAESNIKDKYGLTALHVAALGGHCDVVTLLLEKQSDINIKDDDGNTALHVAARGGHYDVVTLLLEHKVEININDDDGNTALHVAARFGFCDMVTLLLEHKADVNIKDNDGDTPLHVAARRGLCDVVTLLLEHQADINIKDDYGDAALHVAAHSGDVDVVTLLLKHQADINVKNDNSDTALHVAARGGHCDVVTLLLQCEAYINVKKMEGHPAHYMALKDNELSIVKLLKEHAASIKVPRQLSKLEVIHVGKNCFILKWDTTTHSHPDEIILSYELYWNDLHAEEWRHCDIPVTESFTLTDLNPDTVYYVMLAARSQRREESHISSTLISTKQIGIKASEVESHTRGLEKRSLSQIDAAEDKKPSKKLKEHQPSCSTSSIASEVESHTRPLEKRSISQKDAADDKKPSKKFRETQPSCSTTTIDFDMDAAAGQSAASRDTADRQSEHEQINLHGDGTNNQQPPNQQPPSY